jgi:hypothetical protein
MTTCINNTGLFNISQIETKTLGIMNSTSDSYLRSSDFESWPCDILTGFLLVFLQSLQTSAGILPKIGNGYFQFADYFPPGFITYNNWTI